MLLCVIQGIGSEQVVKDRTLPVAKLSKECQSRVKQIAFLATKVRDLATPENDELTKAKSDQKSVGAAPEADTT